jgi:UDP-glucose 4-epimerase
MRILVTGGAGFIGSHVADDLLAQGHEVMVLDDLSTGRCSNVPERADFVEIDLRDGAAVRDAIANYRPQMVSHQAAQTSVSVSAREPVRDAEINVLGSLHLLEACVAAKTERVIFASTGGAIYGEVPDGERATIDTAPAPVSPYACSKFAVENYLKAYRSEHGLDFRILRYANVYGPRQDPHGEAGVVAIFSERLLAAKPVQINARSREGDDGCVRDYVFVKDVVMANRLAVEGAIDAPITNVCSAVATTTMELARKLEHILGIRAEIGFGPRREGDVECSVLGLAPGSPLAEPTSLDQGLEETARWFQAR